MIIVMQVFKFCCYVSIPVLMTVFIAGSPARLEAIIRNVRLPAVIPSLNALLQGSTGPLRTVRHGVASHHVDDNRN